jgi:hypothetical protein
MLLGIIAATAAGISQASSQADNVWDCYQKQEIVICMTNPIQKMKLRKIRQKSSNRMLERFSLGSFPRKAPQHDCFQRE